ncbi:hypothetical protein SAMN05421538_103130 [Paracoccus isoporae]|uniref:Uncharacterized protein n=1 Tax=Paracoccus isoporae TaxID=591205 RepID=A0A1G6Z1B2_9RHOB|nr:hypothetical protein [Paracoccus isoporae]SDD96388.1 hypothetical protein SAMN05421538_103130 [Paracoccus isoporae]
MPDWRGGRDKAGRATIIGAALTALWLVMLLLFWLTSGGAGDGPGRWVSIVAALMPVALIWVAVRLAHSVQALGDEAQDLRASLEHHLLRREPPRGGAEAAAPETATPRLAAPPPRPAPPAATRERAAAPPPVRREEPRQSSLGFDAPEPVDLPAETVLRALNFPDGPDDAAAIAALRDALRDPDHARLIRSAQDVVTLLADRGIYTDDLEPAPADAAAWRRFAEGQRGQAVSGVGAVHDPQMLEAAVVAMRSDDVFRDAVHHFLRLFDRGATALLPRLSDDEIVWLAETRSARAFMLMARAAGLFGQEEG